MPDQQEFQLKLPQAELDRIATRVQHDYRSAISDHNRRLKRWAEYFRRWRGSVDTPALGEEAASNVPVPFIRWNIFAKWAKEMDALFGDDAEIVAVPVGASDYKRDKKISKYMTWRVFNSMKLTNPFCEFVLRKILYGRSFAYSPWKRDTFEVEGKEIVDYEGPEFYPLASDDFICPAEDVRNLHEFSFVMRRARMTPDQLLKGEEDGKYQGIKKNWEKIVQFSQRGQKRDFEGEDVKREQDAAEGISYENPQSSGEQLMIIEWYGRWRPLKSGKKDGAEWDFKAREMRQRDYLVAYLWDLNMVIGVQSLETLYPTKKNRRPFVEASMLKDGSYWSPGLAEMLIDLEDELRVNHNQATEAAQLAMSPPMGYRPAAGVTPEMIKLEPGLAIPLDNPQQDLIQIKIGANLETATWKEQLITGYGEKLTGLSDMQLGRQPDRPNAPRTGVQTVKLLEEGNVRISLDAKVLREDMCAILTHFWDLEYMFSPEQMFFRVTEDDADGLFEVNNGGSMLTIEDRDGRYDFRLQFANSVESKEVKKEQALARYQLDLQNPLIIQNPVALWEVTRDAHEALGDPNFQDLVAKPGAPDLPVDPKVEWTEMQQGEEVHVNPLDNDQLHMMRHMKDLKLAETDPNGDPDAIKHLVVHYHDHIIQLQQKRLQQALIEQATQAAAQIMNGGNGGAAPGGKPLAYPQGLFGNPPQQPAGNPQAAGPNIYSGHQANEDLHGGS